MGGAIATAIYTSIQTSRFTQVLAKNVGVAAKSTGFTGNMASLLTAATKNTAAAYKAVPGISNATTAAVISAVRQSQSEGYKMVYLVAIAFGAIAITASFTTKGISISQRTDDVAAHIENEKVVAKQVG
jgi:ATP phosphoribosyltransferase regulatory subunit HisZ